MEGRNQLLQLPDSLSVDSRLLIGSNKIVQIRRGASQTTKQITTAAALANAQIIWNIQLNNKQTIIDPYMYAEVGFTATITCTGLTGPQTVQNYLNDYFSFRQYPFNSIIQVATVMYNNQQVTSNPNQFVHQLGWNQKYFNQAAIQSLTPIMPDQSQQYSDLTGSQKSPLLNYVDGGEHYSEPRGSYNQGFVTSVSNVTTWTFQGVLREPIMNPLLEYDPSKPDREGFAFVNLLNIQLNMVSNTSRIFSDDAINTPGITSVQVQLNYANLIQTWLTAPVNQQLPPRTLRSFNTIVCNQTNIQQPVSAGQQVQLQSQAYQFSQIPKKIFIYVCDFNLDTATGYQLTDTNFSIQTVSILFNNVASLFATWNAADLYNAFQAAENSQMTFMQSQYRTGSVLCLDPTLFGLQPDQAPGMLGNFNFSALVTCTNISNRTITPTLFITNALDTVLETSEDYVSNLIQGFVTSEDVLRVNSLPARPANFSETDIYGGNFLDDVKGFFSKIFNFAKENKLASRGLKAIGNPFTNIAGDVIEQLGYGYPSVAGGRRTSKAQMRNYRSLMM